MKSMLPLLVAMLLSLPSGAHGSDPEPAQALCPTRDPLCKEVRLVAPTEPGVVVMRQGPVELVFGREAFLKAAKVRRRSKLAAWIEGHQTKQTRLDGPAGPGPELIKESTFVAAGLLEAGRAKAVVAKTGRPVDRIVVQHWDWIGCSGGCRQAGREFRLTVPGKPFLKTTDLFEDGLPGAFNPPPAKAPASE